MWTVDVDTKLMESNSFFCPYNLPLEAVKRFVSLDSQAENTLERIAPEIGL